MVQGAQIPIYLPKYVYEMMGLSDEDCIMKKEYYQCMVIRNFSVSSQTVEKAHWSKHTNKSLLMNTQGS